MKRILASSDRFPWRTRWVILLLAVLVSSVAFALSEIALGLDAALALTIVVLALGLGWVMAAGRVSAPFAVAAALLAGAAVLTVRIGRIGGQLLAIPSALGELVIESIRLKEFVSAEPLSTAFSDLALALGVLYGRLWEWLRTLVTDEWAMDPVASAFTWAVLIWIAAVWAAWFVRRRRQPLSAVLPILALLGISYLLSRGRPASFVIPLGSTLLLMAFAGHDSRAFRWARNGIDSPEGKTSSLALIVVPIALLLTAAAAWAQTVSIIRFVNVIESLAGGGARDERALAGSLGLSRGSAPDTGLEALFSPGLPNSHLIGSGPELSDQVAMEVTVANLPMQGPAPEFRWKALTYDQYLGRGWRTSNLYLEDYEAGEPVREPVANTDMVVRQFVREIGDLGGRVFSAGSPAVLDQPVEVAWRSVGEDTFALSATSAQYQVESIVPQAGQPELRASGTDYPDWIREGYLALPDDVPERVLALGRDLTATEPTPYDRAVAIEAYLRAIPYTLDVSRPPPDRDVVDYFLFDLREGYCDYYASSMVVLARAAGLPARLVVGYYTGTSQTTEGTIRYLVTEAEAHSWVEVYFPEIGWVEFEPTGGRAAIERSEAAVEMILPEAPDLELAKRSPLKIRVDGPIWGIALVPLVGWMAWVLVVDPLSLRRRPPQEALGKLYRRLRSHAVHLQIDLAPGDTPFELQSAIARSPIKHMSEQTLGLIGAYARATYAEGPVGDELSSHQIRAWRGLSFQLWLERAKRTLRLREKGT